MNSEFPKFLTIAFIKITVQYHLAVLANAGVYFDFIKNHPVIIFFPWCYFLVLTRIHVKKILTGTGLERKYSCKQKHPVTSNLATNFFPFAKISPQVSNIQPHNSS